MLGSKNIRTSEAAPVKSRRSPARATNPGRAITPVLAASCRPSSSSLHYLLVEVQRHDQYCSTHYLNWPAPLVERTLIPIELPFRNRSRDPPGTRACPCFLDLCGI